MGRQPGTIPALNSTNSCKSTEGFGKYMPMPPQQDRPQASQRPVLVQRRRSVSIYPREAFDFIRRGLSYTMEKVHGSVAVPGGSRHVSGQQLCHGLREFSLAHWGMLSCPVLHRWNIHSTEDFGKIVFMLIEIGELAKTKNDVLDDFRDVYSFAEAFGSDYRLNQQLIRKGMASCI
jgi:uncharacterized repeat protein (TIGR04138 family)